MRAPSNQTAAATSEAVRTPPPASGRAAARSRPGGRPGGRRSGSRRPPAALRARRWTRPARDGATLAARRSTPAKPTVNARSSGASAAAPRAPAVATPFWRAAEAGDVDAMRLLVARGADPAIKTVEGVSPLMVLAGAGYRDTSATTTPAGRMPALRYLVEELHADVNETDAKAGNSKKTEPIGTRGYTPIHNAAARGDNEMILYLVSKGARVDLVGKNGVTSVDMASSPRERGEPFPRRSSCSRAWGRRARGVCRLRRAAECCEFHSAPEFAEHIPTADHSAREVANEVLERTHHGAGRSSTARIADSAAARTSRRSA